MPRRRLIRSSPPRARRCSSRCERSSEQLKVGDAVIADGHGQGRRHARDAAAATSLRAAEGLAVYPAQPTLQDRSDRRTDVLSATRVDRVTYMLEKPGDYVLPAIELGVVGSARAADRAGARRSGRPVGRGQSRASATCRRESGAGALARRCCRPRGALASCRAGDWPVSWSGLAVAPRVAHRVALDRAAPRCVSAIRGCGIRVPAQGRPVRRSCKNLFCPARVARAVRAGRARAHDRSISRRRAGRGPRPATRADRRPLVRRTRTGRGRWLGAAPDAAACRDCAPSAAPPQHVADRCGAASRRAQSGDVARLVCCATPTGRPMTRSAKLARSCPTRVKHRRQGGTHVSETGS